MTDKDDTSLAGDIQIQINVHGVGIVTPPKTKEDDNEMEGEE